MELTKLAIAERQLELACALYLAEEDYLGVVTLAGASEEIMGKLLQRQGRAAMIDHLIELDRELSGGRPFKVVNDEVNRARNALKHANDPNEDLVVIEPGEANAMLGRALVNLTLFGSTLTETMVRAAQKLATESGM